jgi:DNA-binding beta-propeller fold protein YncE
VVAETGVLGEMTSITFSPDGAWMYVPNYSSSVVEIIDPGTLQITGQLPASSIEENYDVPWSITASQDGRRIVVAGRVNLTVIDAVSQRVLGAVPYTVPLTGAYSQPGAVTLSPHGDRAYIVSNSPPGQIQVIDTALLRTANTLTLSDADDPTGAGVSPDSSTLYVGERYCTSGVSCDCYFDSCLPRLLEVNTTTLAITGQIALGTTNFYPGGIVITRDGNTAYVEGLPVPGGLTTSGGVSVVDLAAGQVTATIPVPNGWQPIAMAANEQFLYEAALSNCDYYSIRLSTQQVTCVAAPGNGEYIAVSANGAYVFSSGQLGTGVLAVATSPNGSGTYLGTVNLPGYSNGVAFSPF